LRSYPVAQRHDALWIWMGDPSLADPSMLPKLDFIDQRPNGRIHGVVVMQANYQLITDNIMDLSHTNILHANSIGGLPDGIKTTVGTRGDQINIRWASESGEPPAVVRLGFPEGMLVDNWTEVLWSPPALMVLNVGFVPTGTTPAPEDSQIALHNMVPETATSTHYFFMVTRGRDPDNEELTAMSRALFIKAFVEEDKPMIEAQQERMGTSDLWSLKPAMLSIDEGAVRVRRKLESLIAQEQAASRPAIDRASTRLPEKTA
jgi:vanillate O-demethylase monooxygenase subunit